MTFSVVDIISVICSENDEAVSRPSLAQDEKYSRALSRSAEMRVRVETESNIRWRPFRPMVALWRDLGGLSG